MRKNLLVLMIMISLTSLGLAHPGVGIVQDNKENIFYTDLFKVWMINKDGKRSVVVPAVHTHELSLDAEGDLYGEHLWYNGEQSDTWGHFIWRRTTAGTIEMVQDSTAGFVTDYGFMRDAAGNQYWLERWVMSRFKRRDSKGKISVVAELKIRDIGWQHVSAKGEIYFSSKGSIYRIDNAGKLRLLSQLTDNNASIMGIWSDKSDRVYFANYASRKVYRVDSLGHALVMANTAEGWSPSGGLIDKDGNLWILEYSDKNEVRVEKFILSRNTVANSQARSQSALNDAWWENWKYAILVLGTAFLFLLSAIFYRKSHRKKLC